MVQDIVYKYTGTGKAAYDNPYTVRAAWDEWLRKVWIKALTGAGYTAQEAAWVPTYEQHFVYWPSNEGELGSAALNPFETPTKETADYLAARYGQAGKPLLVLELPYYGAGGPVATTAKTRLLQWPTGETIPAGSLAGIFTNNPESVNDVADKLCRMLIADRLKRVSFS